MRHDDGEDAVRLQVVKLVEQEGIVGLGLRGKTVLCETCVHLLLLRVPMLGVWRIADHSIHSQGLVNVGAFLVEGPVLVEAVGTFGDDVLGDDATHHKVHAGKVIGVLLQLLCIVLHLVLALDMLAHSLTDCDKQ